MQRKTYWDTCNFLEKFLNTRSDVMYNEHVKFRTCVIIDSPLATPRTLASISTHVYDKISYM